MVSDDAGHGRSVVSTPSFPMIIVLMGVSGSGKSTVGRALATTLGWAFVEGDELHAQTSVEKMAGGIALGDDDRLPWLEAVAAVVEINARSAPGVVVACSALRERYRRILDPDGIARFVLLDAPHEILARRLRERVDHFFAPSLLDSQLEALEQPADALVIDASLSSTDAVLAIRGHFGI